MNFKLMDQLDLRFISLSLYTSELLALLAYKEHKNLIIDYLLHKGIHYYGSQSSLWRRNQQNTLTILTDNY